MVFLIGHCLHFNCAARARGNAIEMKSESIFLEHSVSGKENEHRAISIHLISNLSRLPFRTIRFCLHLDNERSFVLRERLAKTNSVNE